MKDRQCSNGGFGYFATEHFSAFVTCHVANAIGLCKDKGYPIPGFGNWLQKLEDYLTTLYSPETTKSYNWPEEQKISIGAYALVRKYSPHSNSSFSMLNTNYADQQRQRKKPSNSTNDMQLILCH